VDEPDTSYDGRFFTLDRAQCDPKPLQAPHPPVLIGGGGEQLTVRVVARLADRSNFGGKPDEFAHKCQVLAKHCDAVGRDYDEIEKTWSPEVFVRETDAEVRAIGGSTFGEPFDSWQAGNLWAAIGICPLAASRRCPLTAISSHRVLAAGDTTPCRCRPAPRWRCLISMWAHVLEQPTARVVQPEPSRWCVVISVAMARSVHRSPIRARTGR
jgi:hypothetical protein